MRTFIRVALGLTFLTVAFAACGSPKKDGDQPTPTPTQTAIPAAPVPPTGSPLVGLVLSGGWTNPRRLPAPVNTIGWEDSANISADGKRLYFSYTQYSQQALATSGMFVIYGPTRPGQKGPDFDIYEATITSGGWTVVDSSVNDLTPTLSE